MGNPLAVIGDPTKASDLNDIKGRTVTAGAGGIAAYDVVYLSAADTVLKADADAAATMPAVGICPAAITAAATGDMVCTGVVTNAAWSWTAGDIIYVSGTAGALTTNRPTSATAVTQVVGIAFTATVVWFCFGRFDAELFSQTSTAYGVPLGNASGKLAAGWGGNASTLATLNSSTKVVEDPANATATPTASKIPIADGAGKLAAGWGGAASTLATLNGSSKVVEEPASKAQASGIASLDGSSLVVQNPANATATPTASKIPIADGSGLLDGWVTAASVTSAIGTFVISATGNVAVSGLGFQPSLVEFDYMPKQTSSVIYHPGRGAAKSSTVRWCWSIRIENSATPLANAPIESAVTVINCAAGAVLLVADFVTMDAGGFTINVSSFANMDNATIRYRAIK